jgi:DNA-binding response OmpR family regulator
MVKKILIVDDDVELCAHLVRILTDAGYQNDAATSCAEALEKMLENFDVILLDMIMPQMRGADCLVELKNRTHGRG